MIPFISNPWFLGAVGAAVLAALGVQQLRIANLRTALAEERRVHAEERADWLSSSEAAEREARRALSEAAAAAEREYWARVAELEAATDDMRDEMTAAELDRDAWRERFEKIKRESRVCSDWAEEKVQCPVE